MQACAPVQSPRRPEPLPPSRVTAAPTPVDLRARLAVLDRALGSFQGQGNIEYDGPGGKLRSAHMVVVKAPDKVRIDFRSPFSLTYTVLSDGVTLVAYDRGEKVLYRGKPTSSNLGRYARVPVDLQTLALLVRGLPPLPRDVNAGSVRGVQNGWLWQAPMSDGSQLAVVFAAADLRPLSASVTGAKGAGFTAYFEKYKDVGGVYVPHEIRAELPDGGRVELRYAMVWRDRAHSDQAFHMDPPGGVSVVEMNE